jgi:hypothetical protein
MLPEKEWGISLNVQTYLKKWSCQAKKRGFTMVKDDYSE